MTISSARPDHLRRYAMLVSDRSGAARTANTRAAQALAAYRSSCPDLPTSVDATTVTAGALTRSDGMVAQVRRVATAFTLADRHDRPVVVIDHEDRFGRLFLSAMIAGGSPGHDDDSTDDRTTVLFRQGRHHTDHGSGTIGPADLAGSYEAFAGTEVARRSFFDIGQDGLDAAIEVRGFTGVRVGADGTVDAGVAHAEGRVDASVGVDAALGANARINLDEVHVDASGGAFFGGRAGLDTSVEAMGVEAGVAGEVRAGIGADFSGEGHVGWDRVGFEVSGGLALGLGAGGRGGISVNPRETVNDAVRIGTGIQRGAGTAVSATRSKAGELIDGSIDAAGDVYRGGRKVFDDGVDFIGKPFGR